MGGICRAQEQDLLAAHTTIQLPGDLGLGVEEVTGCLGHQTNTSGYFFHTKP